MTCTIRSIEPSDYENLLELIKEFSVFERSMGAVTNSVEKMNEEREHINGFMADVDGKIAGYVTYYFPYHTWVGKCIHMDDLFVTEEYRNQGIGEKMMDAVLDIGKKENCNRLRWQVSDWNKEAQDFYRKKGATIKNSEFDCEILLEA